MTVKPWDTTKRYKPGDEAVVDGKVCEVVPHSLIRRNSSSTGCLFCPKLMKNQDCGIDEVCNNSITNLCVWVDRNAQALARLKGGL